MKEDSSVMYIPLIFFHLQKVARDREQNVADMLLIQTMCVVHQTLSCFSPPGLCDTSL